jgi:hypothetical protein
MLFSLQDADHDLPRRFLLTSLIRVQFRSDRGWQLDASDLISSRSTWVPVSSVDFLGRHRRRPVLVSGVHANFHSHVSAKAASTALTCEECGVRFISRLKYTIQAWRHVYDSLCIRLPSRSSKLSSRSLRLGNKELLHTTQFQTTLHTKVRGTMRSLAGRCYYFSPNRSIDQHCWRLYTFRPRWQWIRL